MKTGILPGVFLALFLAAGAYGEIINVPGDSTTIQAAIRGASAEDTVLVAENHYYERLDLLGKNIFLTSNYLYTNDTLTVQNTIIDGDTSVLGASDTACVIILCNGETQNAVVQGFTIQNGLGYKNEFDRWLGGGIMCIGTSPTITHNIIRQNSAIHCGGGLCGIDSSHAVITYNTFIDNSAGSGGAVIFSESSPVISHNDIIDNFVDTTGYPTVMTMGGGIYTYKCASTITHNTISKNTASIGGGICCYVLDTDSIADNEITFNSAVGDSGLGGGISCFHTFSGTITNNTITDNSANGGGGIHLYLSNAIPEESALIDSNVITRNTAIGGGTGRGGGGIILQQFFNGSITGNLLTENVAPASGGGGIAFWQSCIPVSENTIAYNSALAGGAVYANATGTPPPPIDITNTICWADTGTSVGKELHLVGVASFNVRYCDVESGYVGEGNIDCDPEFCQPDTGDYYLNQNSCCVGAGEAGVDIGAFGVGCDTTGVCEEPCVPPAQFSLSQNSPNPFNRLTKIKYSLPRASGVRLDIYDILGRKVETLLSKRQPAGYYQVTWNPDNATSGIYLCRMQIGERTETIKMLLLE